MMALSNKKVRLPIFLTLALLTFVVYLPVHKHEFMRYDDDVYVTNNPEVQSGLSWQGIKWAFVTDHGANWHPLTWLSLMLDCELFGVKPGPLHLVNVLFHIANTLLLFIVFNRMTKALWQSAFIAALFALHPLHVESVAWIAERKDVLSTLFWLLTMLAYVRYVERSSAGRYILALIFFALGLLAKPMLVTLPFVLLLLDYWPLDRFSNSRFSIRNSIIEKLPFFFLSILSSVITFVVQQKGGAVFSGDIVPFNVRLANAICSYFVYIEKMFWPVRLAVLYPYSIHGISLVKVLLSATVLVLVTVLVLYNYRRRKYLIVGWLWYLGTLVPVIGIVQVGVQAFADRYTYVPLTGLFIMCAFASADLLKNVPFKKYILATSATIVLLACTILTTVQLIYWKDSGLLFERALAVTENNVHILNNYGNALGAMGRHKEAAKVLEQAVRGLPDSYEIRNNYGKALQNLGKLDEAIEQYQIALKIEPTADFARYNLSVALAAKGNLDAAIEQCRIVLAARPDDAEMHTHLGILLQNQGKLDQAIESYKKALQIDPKFQKARENLDAALAQKQAGK
ncbi:MAG: tetratricopeptide repeat protein [Sedimentisphaerales bacterium]|jgi:Flp pilus assembly protein TadD